jgi:catechol 2,3-dioxygenase-like lactoylglutathione lyase family enzyme
MAGPRISFSHFGINCFDLAKMEKFYTEVIGFVVTDHGDIPRIGEQIRFLTLDPRDHHQLILCSGRTEGDIVSGSFAGGGAGSAINQLSFRVADLDELRKMRDRLAAVGRNDGTPLNHGNAWAMYIRDIEGNPMEFFTDSPWYVPQPFGEPLDLDKSNEEILAETEKLCRTHAGFEPVEVWRQRVTARLAERHAS